MNARTERRPWLEALNLTMRSRERGPNSCARSTILNDVSLEMRSGELVAILGPSGAGKSTLLRLLAGRSSADVGQVIMHNLPPEKQRSPAAAVAYLDQDDILHGELQVQRALELTAGLRRPKRPRQTSLQAVERVMDLTSISARRLVPVGQLSGGERRRVNLCAELLSDFSFLFLDEPTASLDPHHSRGMLELARGIADNHPGNPAVVVVTHDVWNTDLYDRVIFLVDGYLVYSGPPHGAQAYFNVADLREVYGHFERHNNEHRRRMLAERAARRWQQWISRHDPVRRPCSPGDRGLSLLDGRTAELQAWPSPAGRGSAALRRFLILLERMFWSLVSDRLLLALCLIQPLLAGLVVIALSDRQSLVQPLNFGLAAKQVIFTLIMMAVTMGLINSHREVVRERRIRIQEQNAGLAPGVYVLSKLTFLAVLSFGQITLMFVVVAMGMELPQGSLMVDTRVEMIVSLTFCAIANTALGLLLSTLAGTSRQATLLLVPALTIELALGGLLFELEGWFLHLAQLVPARWTYEAMGTIADVNQWNPVLDQKDPMFLYDANHLWHSWAMLAALTVGYGLLTWLSLELKRHRGRARHLAANC